MAANKVRPQTCGVDPKHKQREQVSEGKLSGGEHGSTAEMGEASPKPKEMEQREEESIQASVCVLQFRVGPRIQIRARDLEISIKCMYISVKGGPQI